MRGGTLRLLTCAALALAGCTCDPTLASARAITLTTLGEGAVTFDPAPLKDAGGGRYLFPKGSTITLTATPSTGGRFDGWEGGCTGPDTVCGVKVDADVAVVARFAVFVDVAFEGSGRVVSTPAGLDCTQSCKKVFGYDAPLTLKATALAGFRFDHWSGDCSGSGDCALTTDVSHAVTAHFAAAPAPCDWVKRFGGPYRETFGGLRRDPTTGRLAFAGTTQGNIDFGGGLLPATTPVSSAVFVAVLDAAGAYQSAFARGRSGAVTLGDGVAWLPSGDVAVTGAWSGLLDFGDGTMRDDGANGFGLFRGFFAVWSPTGALKSVQPLGETTVLLAGFSAISSHPATGATTLAGTFAAAENFGGPATLMPRDFDAYVAQYQPDGGFRWAQGGGGAYYDQSFALHAAADGTVRVAGTMSGDAEMSGARFDAGASNGAFVLTYGSDGGLVASDFLSPIPLTDGGYYGAEGRAVAQFPSGDVVVGGYYSGQVMASGTASVEALGTDGYVARLGSQPWFARLGGSMFDEVVAVAVDPQSEDVWVLGDFRGSATFQTSPVNSAGNGDIFLLRYSKTGQLLGARFMGGPGDDFARGLQIDPFGRALVAGEFENTASFGVGNLTSAGDVDLFVGCFAP